MPTNWSAGKSLTDLEDLRLGVVVFCVSTEFNAVNLCKVTRSDLERGICYARFISAVNTEHGRFNIRPEPEFAIWDFELKGPQRHFFEAQRLD